VDVAFSKVEQLRQAVADEERARIVEALAACAGNQTKAAGRLGIARRTLVKKLARLNIPRPRRG
jgi:DNA-binding NtrC family response regulator